MRKPTSLSLSESEKQGLKALAQHHKYSITGFVRAIATGVLPVGQSHLQPAPRGKAIAEIRKELDQLWDEIEEIHEALATKS